MKQEKYEFQDGRFVIIDDELGLSLKDVFSPSLINIADPEATQLKEGESLVVQRDKNHNIYQAFIEKSGIRHGQFCYFYPDGVLQGESFYKEGQLHGPSSFYTEKGQRLSLSYFFLGKHQGKTRYFYPDQGLFKMESYKDGKLSGPQLYFFETGTVKTIMSYKEGLLSGVVRLYYEDGQMKREAFFQQGEKHGFDRIWTEQGVLIDEGEYHMGQAVGTHRRWYDSGQLMEEIFYHTPKRFDKKRWDEKQNILYEGVYDKDLTYKQKVRTEAGDYHVQTGKWDMTRLVLDKETRS